MYSKGLSRQYPGLFIILLDQSASMSEEVPGKNISKISFATAAINDLIYKIREKAGVDPQTGSYKDLAYLTVWGYGDGVYPLLDMVGAPLSISYLSDHTRGMYNTYEIQRNMRTGEWVYEPVVRPSWIEPWAAGQRTEMAQGLTRARDIVRYWLAQPAERGQAPHFQAFPPIVINITDGRHNGTGDPELAASEIRAQQSQDGHALLFSCHFTSDAHTPVIFPSSEDQLASLDPFAVHLFRMSSELPPKLRERAGEVYKGQDVPTGSRGLIYNANSDILVDFLLFGTIGTVGYLL